MPGRDKERDHISLSDYLQKADADLLKPFLEYLSPGKDPLSPGKGNVRRAQFWRKSVAAEDQHEILTALLHDYCKDGTEQLNDVRPDDEQNFKYKDSHSVAKRYASKLRDRMRPDLETEFSKDWPGKNDVLNKLRHHEKSKSSCLIL